MAIKVHGNPFSPPSQRVLLALAEKDLDYEYVFVDMSTVPAFEDGDLKLFESRAITRYIAYAYADKGTPLFDQDPKKVAIISVWLEVEALKFDAAGSKLSFEILIKPLLGMTTDEGAVEQQQGQLASVLDVYEARLSKSKYLGGDSFTLVDLHHVPIVNNMMKTKVKALFDARPHVSAWASDILARPAWAKVLDALKI
ncbi:hypothetical protein ACJIZ3_011660 [Penstemon smallii]|uniref:glutathione transferase n=1 Tax=Penstemon smallii TaxID=265156 RepID=A0ABD3UN04_9LAMI